MALGMICPEKGFHLGLAAATRAGVPFVLAGKVFAYAEHERYFREELQPVLTPPHRFVGPLGIWRKARLLAGARCLLVPSLVPETASLVAMEALACGTPVVAFPAGALADVVEHGRTGFLVRDVDEMAAAIPRAAGIGARDCRRAAQTRFSADRMARQYFEVYRRIAARRSDYRLEASHLRIPAVSPD
jgi:glycosyltransferase involved in cell wall biosynthesis